jgi:hypothetical protein
LIGRLNSLKSWLFSSAKGQAKIPIVALEDARQPQTDLKRHLEEGHPNDVVLDEVIGDLYTSSSFGVVRLAAGTASWTGAVLFTP